MNNSINKFFIILYSLLVSAFVFLSCSENISTQEDTRQTFEIDLADYSTNHFFLDTIYASVLPKYNLYNRYHQLIPWVNNYYQIKNLTIWKQAVGSINHATQKRSNAFINLPSLRKVEKYDSTFYDITQYCIVGKTTINTRFELLQEGIDYTYNPFTGVVSLLNDVSRYVALAATYSIEGKSFSDDDDIYFGDYLSEEIAILKLIKPQNLQPNFKQAWKLQLRNIYPIGAENILVDGFELEIGLKKNGKLQNYIINKWGKEVPLIAEFGFDKLDENANEKSDGKFDFRESITINSITGEIIFPILEPFGRDLPKSIPDSFKTFSIYDTTKSFIDTDNIPFRIKGKYNN